MDNPETLAALGAHDTGLKHIKHKNTTHKNEKMNHTDPHKPLDVNACAR